MTEFSRRLLEWHARAGRHGLPWQRNVTPYRVWISEIMLQQTQVNTVIPYFERFMDRFPDVASLADADLDAVLNLWSGLGYYSRARNLHRTARVIQRELKGGFPVSIDKWLELPGIGRSTAGAILALSMNQAHPVLDGNVQRVLCRYYAIRVWPGERATGQRLWRMAEKLVDRDRPAVYTQAIMDLGATLCTRVNPDCQACPVRSGCRARRLGLQRELPRRKPSKTLPVKRAAFVMVENAAGEILLQKRPPAGIWGGLWGFPECPLDADIARWLEENYGLRAASLRYTPRLRHTFSHFHLEITPVRVQLQSRRHLARDADDLYWFRPAGDNRLIGLAAPVRKLIARHLQPDEYQ
jgi:A/G-specific adenine glycosylase